jgi:hypothetical protein
MSEMSVPEDLLRAVALDLRPVAPLRAPWQRALALAPLGLLLLVATPALWGLRHNFAEVGTPLAWGVSFAQLLAGLAIVGLALRESVPGRGLPGTTIAAAVAGAMALVVGITLVTDALVPTTMPADVSWRYAWECLWMAAAPGLLAVIAAAWLSSRAQPNRPAVAGALYGLGAGVMADSGARLFCWVSSPGHVLLAHGGAIVTLTLVGAAVAVAIDHARN